jgi:hypothetical protein
MTNAERFQQPFDLEKRFPSARFSAFAGGGIAMVQFLKSILQKLPLSEKKLPMRSMKSGLVRGFSSDGAVSAISLKEWTGLIPAVFPRSGLIPVIMVVNWAKNASH